MHCFGSKDSDEPDRTYSIGSIVPALAQNEEGHPQFLEPERKTGHEGWASRLSLHRSLSEQPAPPARCAFFSADCLLTLLRHSSLLVPKCDLLLLILHCLLLLPVSPSGLLRLLHRPLRGLTRVLCCLLSCLLCPLCRLLIQIHHKIRFSAVRRNNFGTMTQ